MTRGAVSQHLKVLKAADLVADHQEGTRRIYRWKHTNLVVKENDPNEVPRRIPPNPDVQLTTFANAACESFMKTLKYEANSGQEKRSRQPCGFHS